MRSPANVAGRRVYQGGSSLLARRATEHRDVAHRQRDLASLDFLGESAAGLIYRTVELGRRCAVRAVGRAIDYGLGRRIDRFGRTRCPESVNSVHVFSFYAIEHWRFAEGAHLQGVRYL